MRMGFGTKPIIAAGELKGHSVSKKNTSPSLGDRKGVKWIQKIDLTGI